MARLQVRSGGFTVYTVDSKRAHNGDVAEFCEIVMLRKRDGLCCGSSDRAGKRLVAHGGKEKSIHRLPIALACRSCP